MNRGMRVVLVFGLGAQISSQGVVFYGTGDPSLARN